MTKNIKGQEIIDDPELKELKVAYWKLGFEELKIREEAEAKIKKLQADAKEIKKKFDKRNKEIKANDSLGLYEMALMPKEE